MADSVLVTRNGRVATLTMNRPDARNAFSTVEQFHAFAGAVDGIRDDHSISVLIVTGAGVAFCSGGDIKDMRNRTNFAAGTALDLRHRYRRDVQRIVTSLFDIDIPTIAAVNGPAIGLGNDLACCCDIRIASENARFAESFIKVGLIPGDGGAWFLQRIVGVSKASELMFTGDTIDAHEAERIGLVSRVTAPDALMPAVEGMAERIAAQPPQTLRMTKRLIRESQRAPLETIFELSAALQSLTQRSEDHQESLDAGAEKRDPVYKGQ
jgi:enoyl-CoA hydratase/carnithine racemase